MSLRDRIAAKLAKWTVILKDMADAATAEAGRKRFVARMVALDGDYNKPAERLADPPNGPITFQCWECGHVAGPWTLVADWQPVFSGGPKYDVTCHGVTERVQITRLKSRFGGGVLAFRPGAPCPACGKPKKHGPPETLCWCE